MSEQIEPGDGWRLLDKQKDTKRPGDEYWSCFDEWVTASNDGIFHSEHVYRRRIPAKPEAFGVLFYQWRVINGKAVILIDMERAEFNAEQARQLANWLNRYAVWREAQESVAKTPPN